MQIPDDILLNEDLNAAIAVLPANYSFEVRHSIVKPLCRCARCSGRAHQAVSSPDTQNSMEVETSQSEQGGNSVS